MANEVEHRPGFFERLGLAFKVLGDAVLAQKVAELARPVEAKTPAALPPEKIHASGLFVLSALQQEGRFIDFLQQDVAGFADEEIGAAARVVHSGCRKILQRLVTISPVLKESEGEVVVVPVGFDPQKTRLTGNVAGQPPFKGTLKHHGWIALNINFPTLSEAVDYRVLAPAEVELS